MLCRIPDIPDVCEVAAAGLVPEHADRDTMARAPMQAAAMMAQTFLRLGMGKGYCSRCANLSGSSPTGESSCVARSAHVRRLSPF